MLTSYVERLLNFYLYTFNTSLFYYEFIQTNREYYKLVLIINK